MKFIIRNDSDKGGLIEYIKALILVRPYVAEIKRISPKRNISQNSLYWAWLNFIAEETGNTPEDLHYYFKKRYIGSEAVKIKLDKNYTSERVLSTRGLSEAEFAEYLDKIKYEIDKFGIVLVSKSSPFFDEFMTKYGG